MWWYYLTQRPPAPGAQPGNGLIRTYEYEHRIYIPAIGREAYGSAVYGRQLTEQEVDNYELVPMPPKPWNYGGYGND